MRLLTRAFVLASMLALLGCGTLPNGRRWGEDAIVPVPTFERVAKSGTRAIVDPMTWIPLLGLLVTSYHGNDKKISTWAIERTPVYGSNDRANTVSNILLGSEYAAVFGTTVLTPSGDDPGQWTLSKLRGLTIEAVAFGSVTVSTTTIKGAVNRPRPTGGGYSFPSGHSAAAFGCAAMASKNLDSIDLPWGVRAGFQVGLYTIASGVAWARVEAGRHYLSDVLASVAIGHLVASCFHDLFMGLDLPDDFGMNLDVKRRSVGLSFHWRF